MKKYCFFPLLLTIVTFGFAQTKNFMDTPYLETSAIADTLVMPDRIFLSITITESDTKGKRSVEEMETAMIRKLESLSIDVKKQLTLSDLSSNFQNYFLRKRDVQKSKTYELLVYDARAAGRVAGVLEEAGISNIFLDKTEYSGMESLKLILRSAAILRAHQQAEAMTKPLKQSLGKAIYISDTNTRVINMLQGQVSGLLLKKEMQEEYAPAPIAFEKIKVESEVRVKFSLE
ncbi:DUF541 domain-containing protein [Sinomicrobium pectinilyticum]|uniref:DUF541 domain-containing protein n=1 Tax=Sinomicrobium pectinilyticum TaxID=1084421 RepID=A0A3N0DS41_SINP1|nr:SIMPL domain-containing protein [Sinomicrobium pectinilyticum]RNL78173.1 DUF541 domain-containing protein [Sinomicrobium pectinilyticum]